MLRLKELRLSAKKTQKELATFLGVDRTTYTKYETGASEPTFETLSRLATYYQVSIEYLMGLSVSEKEVSTVQTVDTKELQQLKELVNQLTPEQQQELLKYGRYLASQQPFSKDS